MTTLTALALGACLQREPIPQRMFQIGRIYDLSIVIAYGLAEGKYAPGICAHNLTEMLDLSLTCSGLRYEFDGRMVFLRLDPEPQVECPYIRPPVADWRTAR